MFRRVREGLREVDPARMTEETRRGLIEDYTAIYERWQHLAELEESRCEAYRYGRLRSRLWASLRLYLVRVNERLARADVVRLRGYRR